MFQISHMNGIDEIFETTELIVHCNLEFVH